MHPLLFGVPLYFVSWLVATTICVPLGSYLAAREGMPAGRSFLAISIAGLSLLLGSKLLYVAESLSFPHDDYVPVSMRGLYRGFRMPGGILLFCITLPLVSRALRLPWRRLGDRIVIVIPIALIFIRLGCFLNGCCFGLVSTRPWAVTFPNGSWAFWFHQTHGWIAPSMSRSLPVHPLQLYYAYVSHPQHRRRFLARSSGDRGGPIDPRWTCCA